MPIHYLLWTVNVLELRRMICVIMSGIFILPRWLQNTGAILILTGKAMALQCTATFIKMEAKLQILTTRSGVVMNAVIPS